MTDLDPKQVKDLLNKVNHDNSFLNLSVTDNELIDRMKNVIEYQYNVIKKRERLVQAITHNVRYLAEIHGRNNEDLMDTKKRLADSQKKAFKMNGQIEVMRKQLQGMEKDQQELYEKRDQITSMVIESQANKNEIKTLKEDIEEKGDHMEKLNLEVTVVVTEKLTYKKELDRVNTQFENLRKDFKEQRVNYNLLIDEVSVINKQNSEYRQLILDNETKLDEIAQEI